MAITGIFNADFSGFFAAVKESEIHLKDLDAGAAKVSKGMSRMADSFSGRKIISEATQMAEIFDRAGGAAAFTEKELARMGATGQEAVAKLTALGKAVPDGLSKMTTATAEAVKSQESLNSKYQQFDGLLQSGGINVSKQVKGLEDMSGMAGKTATSLGAMGTAAAITGAFMTGWQIGKWIDGLTGASTAVEKLTNKITGWGDALKEQEAGAKLDVINRALALGAEQGITYANAITFVETQTKKNADAAIDWAGKLTAAQASVGKLTAAQVEQIDTAKRLGASVEEITNKYGLSADGQKILAEETAKNKKATEDAARAAEQLAAAQAEMQSAGEGWQGTLEGLNNDMVLAIQGYLKAGVSQAALATAYGLTATQIKAVASSLKEADDIQKITDKSIQETGKLWEQHYADQVAMGGSAREIKLADIDAWFNSEVAKLDQSDLNWQSHYNALAARRADFVAADSADWKFIEQSRTSTLEDTANKSQQTFEYMTLHSEDFSRGHIEEARRRRDADLEAWRSFRDEGVSAIETVKAAAVSAVSAFDQMAESVAATTARARESLASLSGGSSSYSMSIPALTKSDLAALASSTNAAAMGMSGASQADILLAKLSALENREGTYAPKTNKEYFDMVKDQTLLAQLRMWAQGQGNPVTMSNTFNIVDTESNIAKRVGDEIMTRVQSGSQLTTS